MKRILAIVCLLAAVAIASAQEWAWPVLARQASQRQVGTSGLTDTPQYEHLVGWWLPRGLAPQADESGAFLRDWSQAGNYMTQSQANAIAPIVKMGSVWAWRGTNQAINSGGDFMQILSTNLLNGKTEMTIAGWYNPDFWTAYAGLLCTRGVSNIINGQTFITTNASAQYVNSADLSILKSVRHSLGQWTHHATVVKMISPSSATMQVYSNGVSINPGTFNPAPFSNLLISATWKIGWDSFQNSRNFAGGVTDLRLYNAALSSNEVYSVFTETTHE
jgi:hypothetical protein